MSATVRDSRFWTSLWQHYAGAPSIALCRVPELEYASQLAPKGEGLDHCCGDGLFSDIAWGKKAWAAGCDLDVASLAKAKTSGVYGRTDQCDAAKRLPYTDNEFQLIFNNSALEHIPDVDAALAEVARVLKPGGTFAFNVLNHRYFEWWPLNGTSAADYRAWQPFFHAFDKSTWEKRLANAGLKMVSVEGYFDREASRLLALLDYEFSGHYLGKRTSWRTRAYHWLPFMKSSWKQKIEASVWRTAPDEGAGYFIKAIKEA